MAIYYRGDTRRPVDDKVFKYGFARRGAQGRDQPRVPFDRDGATGLQERTGDMNGDAAVCITKRMEICPIFPFGWPDPRWVYAFHVDEAFVKDPARYSQYVDTHAWQKEEAFRWPDFAWEEAVGAIDPPDIIGAVRVEIQPIVCNCFGKTGAFRVKYQTFEVLENEYCQVPADLKVWVLGRLKAWAGRSRGSYCGITPPPDENTTRPGLE